MERKRNKIVPISPDHPRAEYLTEYAILFVDDSQESQDAEMFVREIRPDLSVESADPKHSDFPLPVLITGTGQICRRFAGIQRAFGEIQKPSNRKALVDVDISE